MAYDQLYEDDRRAIAQYEARERGFYEFLWASDLPPEFPVVAERGEIEFDITATRARSDAFGDTLDERGHRYELVWVVHAAVEVHLLTDRQREALSVAHREGYFTIPRECTVDEWRKPSGSTCRARAKQSSARLLWSSLTT